MGENLLSIFFVLGGESLYFKLFLKNIQTYCTENILIGLFRYRKKPFIPFYVYPMIYVCQGLFSNHKRVD